MNPPASGQKSSIFNVPNVLTSLRLALAIVLFAMIAYAQAPDALAVDQRSQLYVWAMIIFVIAAGTDWIDGFWARRYGQVTVVGRIFDPFADKVIICGAFIFLAASPGSQITAWMAVLVVARELLVTALRSFFERKGTDFSAKWAGKLKMLLQCAAVAGSLWLLSYQGADQLAAPSWLVTTVVVMVWAAIITTIYSGAEYIVAAVRLAQQDESGG